MASVFSQKTQIEYLLETKQMQRKRGTLKAKRGIRQLFPGAIERKYVKYLNDYVSRMIQITREQIFPELPRIVESAGFLRPNIDSKKSFINEIIDTISSFYKDDYSDEIDNLIAQSDDRLRGYYSDADLRELVLEIAVLTTVFNKVQIMKVFKQMIGIDIILNDPYLQEAMRAFVKENVSLIKTIDSRYFSKLEQIIYNGARQGIRSEVIEKQIMAEFGKTRNIARRIARDQINKFNGQLTMLRQTSLGIKKYIWRTSGDERVRGNPAGRWPNAIPSHWAREGKEFYWNNPPEDGHPQQPIRCRCYAEPVLTDIINKVNTQ